MKKLGLILLVLSLSGCAGESGQAPVVSTGAVDSNSPAQQPVVEESRGSFYSPLPDDNIRFDFPFHLKADRFYEGDAGMRRALVLEFLEGDAKNAREGVERSLSLVGYAPVGIAKMDGNGRMVQGFAKDGEPRLTVAVSDEITDPPTNPAAKGQIWINWEVQPGGAQGTPAP